MLRSACLLPLLFYGVHSRIVRDAFDDDEVTVFTLARGQVQTVTPSPKRCTTVTFDFSTGLSRSVQPYESVNCTEPSHTLRISLGTDAHPGLMGVTFVCGDEIVRYNYSVPAQAGAGLRSSGVTVLCQSDPEAALNMSMTRAHGTIPLSVGPSATAPPRGGPIDDGGGGARSDQSSMVADTLASSYATTSPANDPTDPTTLPWSKSDASGADFDPSRPTGAGTFESFTSDLSSLAIGPGPTSMVTTYSPRQSDVELMTSDGLVNESVPTGDGACTCSSV